MSEQEFSRDASDPFGPEAPPPRKGCLTPLTCCLGCGGLGVVVIGGLIVYGLLRLFPGEPLEFDMPLPPPVAVQSAETKKQALEAGRVREVAWSADELNALLQEFLAEKVKTDIPAKARIDITENDKIHFRVTVPYPEKPVIGRRYANFEFLGRLSVENGKLTVSDVDTGRIGDFSVSEGFAQAFTQFLNQVATEGKEGRNEELVNNALRKVESLAVEGGAIRLKLTEGAPAAPPEKK